MKPVTAARKITKAEPLYYSVAEVARIFGVSTVSLYRAINDGEFPAVRIRGRFVVPRRAIDEITDAAVSGQTLVDASDWVPEAVG